MSTTIVIALIVSLGAAVLVEFLGLWYQKRRIAELTIMLKDTAKIASPKQVAQQKEEAAGTTDSNELYGGLVLRTTSTWSGRSTEKYTLTDKMPVFGTVSEAVLFGSGLLSKMEDLSVANISPYGYVTTSANYVGLKILLGNILEQINRLEQLNVKDSSQDRDTD